MENPPGQPALSGAAKNFRAYFGKQLAAFVAVVALSSQPTSTWGQISETTQPRVAQPSPQPYLWRNVVIGGGGFVTGLVPHPAQKNLIYARTDVGGAYRSDDAGRHWIPITDWIGMKDASLTGIESLAIDPADPQRVYLAAGIYSGADAAMLRSDDQGKTFQRTDVPFKMGGNEAGRFNGERLAVDPHQGEILFFGSRHDGLWKSTDRSATWQKVENFPAIESTPQSVGIVCVLFDPASGQRGEATPVLYAAVSTTSTNLYRSADGGSHWAAVANQPVGLLPNHLVRAVDGNLYVSYGNGPGPNDMSDGAVWKFNPATGIWTDITPLNPAGTERPFGYGAVAVDAADPNVIVATTFCRWQPHDDIFRSTNGGVSWRPLLDKAALDHSFAPYTASMKPHWLGSVAIDPFNSDCGWFTTGYGIWRCDDLTKADSGQATHWTFDDDGLEETVPLTLVSPPEGAHLLSGLGDIDGFRHDDLNASPAGANFAGPRFINTEDIAFAGQNPRVLVRCGTGRTDPAQAAISSDGGKNWIMLASKPPDITGAGNLTISADGQTIVWTPRRSRPYFSVDQGTDWTACAGLSARVWVMADTVNPAQFYAYDKRTGQFLTSTNGAASFAATKNIFPATQGFAGSFGHERTMLAATPDVTGDVWLILHQNGLYHSTNGGASFVKLENVPQAYALGFGKAAPGKKYPALYLIGQVNGTDAIFRSDNAGALWTRINDDAHQFGAMSHITGDPRVYGRVYFVTGGRGIIYGDPLADEK